MRGRFDEARTALANAKAILTELGLVSEYGLCAGFSGYVEGLAGNLEAAEQDHREARGIFEQTGESCRRLTAEVELAHTLVALDRGDEALELAEIAARETPADEFYCHVLWRTARAKALAHAGGAGEAELLARQALALVENTDDLSTHAGVLVDLGDVLCADGRAGEAVPLLEAATRLYERKGNLVLAARTRSSLDELRATGVPG
jgi:tetratricopeptide (TPR) repeat protein